MKKNPIMIILGVLVGLNLLAWIAVWELGQDGLEVTFFDVGQGDAAFIETPEGQQILIDGGSTAIILEKLGEEMPFWDRTIDLIILTHPEQDHLAGFLEVLKRYEVENILWTGVLRDTAEYQEWIRLLQEEGAKIYIAESGLRISGGSTLSTPGVFPSTPGVYAGSSLFVLYPFESLESKEVKNTNATSIILRLSYGETSFLFTGDAPKSIESQLLSLAKQSLGAGVLKVGHHGSKTSTSEAFVEAVSPEIAVISADKDNKYGHPHQEVLNNLLGIRVLRTDLDGDIKIVSNGADYIVKN